MPTAADRFRSKLSQFVDPAVGLYDKVPEPLSSLEYEMVDVDAGKIWISRNDEVMRPYMQRAHCWEPDEGALLLSLASPTCRFLDVGANVGYFSLLLGKAASRGSVDSVEPDPDNARALRFNLWANRIRARVWPLALDDRDSALTLSGNPHNFGDFRSGRVTASEPDVDTAHEQELRKQSLGEDPDPIDTSWIVPAASGEELFAESIFDLVKIDVQGWEFPVILGLDPVLRRGPVSIVTEFWPEPLRATGRDPVDILARYRDLGYSIQVQTGAQLKRLSDADIVSTCDSAGVNGQVNLLLER